MNPRLAPLMAGAAAATTAALVLALRLYRPWQLRWGSTDEEVHSALPGDEVVPDPTFAATRAITVDAPPERVWPWITHMGFGSAAGTATTCLTTSAAAAPNESSHPFKKLRSATPCPWDPAEAVCASKAWSQANGCCGGTELAIPPGPGVWSPPVLDAPGC
jgi:hypothetical protein